MQTELGLHHEWLHEQCWPQKQCQWLESLHWQLMQACCQWPLLPQQWQVSLAAGQSRWAACGVPLHQKQARVLRVCEAHDPCGLKERQGGLDLTASDVILYAVSSPGGTWCTESNQLLDEVLVIYWIIQVEVRVISQSWRLRLITLTENSIILDITKLNLILFYYTLNGKN